MTKVKFHIPGLFEHWDIVSYINYQLKMKPRMFNPWVEIESFYGCGPNIKLTGGRPSPFNLQNFEIPESLNDWQMNATLVLSNSLVTEEDLSDKNTNDLLTKFHKEGNAVVIASDILEKYIRENYPKYKIYSSVTKILTKEEIAEELNKDYDIVCLLHDHNKDFDFLKSLPHPEKIELIPNHMCTTGQWDKCRDHYKFVSKCNKELKREKFAEWKCPHEAGCFYQMLNKDFFIKAEDIPMYKEKFGIENIKINGRHLSPPDLIECLAYYLIKPEYQVEFRTNFFLGPRRN